MLGLEISLRSQASVWPLNPDKFESWLAELYHVLDQDWLPPAAASKWCGRLSVLSSHIFGRVGRAMLRPFIWRQAQLVGSMHVTRRLKSSIRWFVAVLERRVYRRILFEPPQIERIALLYTDAESSGQIAAVLISESVTRCWVVKAPARDVKRLV